MGRVSWIAGFILLSGCGALGDVITGKANVVARAGGEELTVTQLADLLVAWEKRPIRWEFVDHFVRHWVDITLLAQRLATGDSLLDTAVVLEATWPHVHQFLIADLQSQLFAQRVPLDSAAVDSIYRAGELRILWHILRRVSQQMTPEEKEAQRASATRIRERLLRGGSWEEANAQNEDSNARLAGGDLGIVRRGQMVPAFERAGFGLAPGELSEVTETAVGYHIVYRPRLEEIPRFARSLESTLSTEFDSLYVEELLSENNVTIRPDAASGIRELAEYPPPYLGSNRVLATYRGERFTAGDFVRWLQFLPIDVHEQVIDAPDEEIDSLVRRLVAQELLWDQVETVGLTVSDSLYDWVRRRYREQLASLWRAVNISPESLMVAAATPVERERIALQRVTRYLEAEAAGETLLQTVQPFLAAWLGRNAAWEIRQRGIERAMARARDMREARQSDSSSNQG